MRISDWSSDVCSSDISGFGGKASLAAILSPEMRAVTIRVNDVAGVAGFVLPGDRVDVLLTRDRTGGEGGTVANNLSTDVLLQNVKVPGKIGRRACRERVVRTVKSRWWRYQ